MSVAIAELEIWKYITGHAGGVGNPQREGTKSKDTKNNTFHGSDLHSACQMYTRPKTGVLIQVRWWASWDRESGAESQQKDRTPSNFYV